MISFSLTSCSLLMFADNGSILGRPVDHFFRLSSSSLVSSDKFLLLLPNVALFCFALDVPANEADEELLPRLKMLQMPRRFSFTIVDADDEFPVARLALLVDALIFPESVNCELCDVSSRFADCDRFSSCDSFAATFRGSCAATRFVSLNSASPTSVTCTTSSAVLR